MVQEKAEKGKCRHTWDVAGASGYSRRVSHISNLNYPTHDHHRFKDTRGIIDIRVKLEQIIVLFRYKMKLWINRSLISMRYRLTLVIFNHTNKKLCDISHRSLCAQSNLIRVRALKMNESSPLPCKRQKDGRKQ